MARVIRIVNNKDYNVHKGFHCHILGLHTYLIKTLGLDCDAKDRKKKKRKTRTHLETMLRSPNEKFSAFSEKIPGKKKKKKRNAKKTKVKKERYEELEEAV